MTRLPILLILLALPAGVRAQELRELCTTRPSLGTSACVVDQGHVVAEIGVADWTRDRDATSLEERLIAGDLLLRLGVTDTSEVQLGWMAFGHVRERDDAAGTRERRSRTGDVSVAFRQNLRNPDSSGTSFGVQPFVTLPVGREPVGEGDWGAGVIVPISFELGKSLKFVLDPEADAAVDQDGDGRHLAYGNVLGLEVTLSQAVTATFEFSSFRDRDPEEHATELLGAFSMGWQPGANLQLDAGVVAGLNHDSPDVRLLTGFSARF